MICIRVNVGALILSKLFGKTFWNRNWFGSVIIADEETGKEKPMNGIVCLAFLCAVV